MQNFWEELYANKALWAVLASSALAQCLKIFTGLIKTRRFNFYWLLGTGGMPSAHSAAVASIVVCVAKELGASSPLFAMSILFALITMFDAQTWRRSIGVQARILNEIVDDLQHQKAIKEDRLRELVGHSPIEVIVGAGVGIAVAYLFYR